MCQQASLGQAAGRQLLQVVGKGSSIGNDRLGEKARRSLPREQAHVG